MLNLSKLAPALAAGCTVVLKPAPDTPYSATWIGKLVAEETDIPAGVVNVVTSADPAAVGEVLTGDQRVDMISFTGSTAVGKRIAGTRRRHVEARCSSSSAASRPTSCSTTPTSRPRSARAGMVCMHSGQGCAITTRMLLPRSRYDEGVEIVKAVVRVVPVRRPDRPRATWPAR